MGTMIEDSKSKIINIEIQSKLFAKIQTYRNEERDSII